MAEPRGHFWTFVAMPGYAAHPARMTAIPAVWPRRVTARAEHSIEVAGGRPHLVYRGLGWGYVNSGILGSRFGLLGPFAVDIRARRGMVQVVRKAVTAWGG
jgi:hypothetical protein